MNFDVSNLDDGSRLKILDYVLRGKNVSCEDSGFLGLWYIIAEKGQ